MQQRPDDLVSNLDKSALSETASHKLSVNDFAMLFTTGDRDAFGSDAATRTRGWPGVPSSGPGGEHVLPLQVHHRRWPSRPESSWAGE